jgi:Zn/Cd-binding protein ZinT
MTDIKLFSTPIFVGKSFYADIDNILSESDFMSFLEKNRVWNCDVETSFFNNDRVLSESSEKLKIAISETLFPFVANYISPLFVGGNSFGIELKDFWVNKYVEKAFQEQHSHADSTVSFVYMHKTTESHSVLRFHNQNTYILDDLAYRNGVQFSFVHQDFNLSQGEFIIFPSFLDHSVVPKNAEGERITLSGNIRIHVV